MPASKNVVLKKFVTPIPIADGTLQSYSDQIDALKLDLTNLLVQKNAILANLEQTSKDMYDYYIKNYT
jgi:hypothetical protein